MIYDIKRGTEVNEDDIGTGTIVVEVVEPFVNCEDQLHDGGSFRTETELSWIKQSVCLTVTENVLRYNFLQYLTGYNGNRNRTVISYMRPSTLRLVDWCDVGFFPSLRYGSRANREAKDELKRFRKPKGGLDEGAEEK